MKKILYLLFTVIIAISACKNESRNSDQKSAGSEEINPDNVVLIDMDIKGMTCTGCENTIKSGVSELDGVVSVEASYMDGKTFVKADTSLVPLSKIAETIASRGYEVTGSTIEKEEATEGSGSGDKSE